MGAGDRVVWLVFMSVAAGAGETAALAGNKQEHSSVRAFREGHSGSTEIVGASGLKLTLVDGRPVLPEMTTSRKIRLAAKRGLDIVFSIAALVVLSPLLIGLAATIRLTSPGPAILRQKRCGKDDKPFFVFKFRTMYADKGDPTGVAHTVVDDPRITPVGRFIRRSNLDELPQLVNVLLGEMSIIGPRPHAIGMLAAGVRYDELITYYHSRLAMRPGITGWAQAHGLRGPADDPVLARRRIEHDLAYIQEFSLWLDAKTFCLTAVHEFRSGSGI